MIESIEFQNFKVLRQTTLKLGPFTLLVGPNGSGKTTALYPFVLFQQNSALIFRNLASAAVKDDPNAVVSLKLRFAHPYEGYTYVVRVPAGGHLPWFNGNWPETGSGKVHPNDLLNLLRQSRVY